MRELIQHEGIVMAVNQNIVHVRIVQSDACAECRAKSMCMSADSREKELDATALESMQVGDKVMVMVAEKLGWKAVLLAYILPFVVLIGSVAVLTALGWSETLSGTMGLVGVAVYYLVLACFKNRLKREFTFSATKCG